MNERLDIKKLSEWGMSYKNVFFIAGPCSAESEEQVMQTAMSLKEHPIDAIRAGIWKPRTRPGTFEGVGSIGLKWLKQAGDAIHVPVTTEVATPGHVEECLKHNIDILWVGARTTSNPFAVQAVADALKGVDIPVLVKNPINPDIELWDGALERINQAGIKRLGAVHRGFSTYEKTSFRNQPIWRIPIELKRRNPDLPIICDPSHICGNTELLFSIAQDAMELLFDGLMLEVHIDPPRALSDAQQQLTPAQYGQLIGKLVVKKALGGSLDFMKNINALRQQIDKIDGQILGLLAERMDNARKIAFLKIKDNVSLFQPARWEEVLEKRIKLGAELNLSEDFVIGLYEFIHEESLRIQRKVSTPASI